MATNMAVNDIVQIRLLTSLPPQIAFNLLYFKILTISGTPTLENQSGNLATQIIPAYKQLISQSAVFRGIGVSRLTPNPTSEFPDVSQAGVGGSASDTLPSQTTGVLKYVDGGRGASHRGRIYLPFPTETFSDALGIPTNPYLANITTFAAILFAGITTVNGINGAGWQWVMRHRKPVPNTYSAVSNYFAVQKWARQKRRGMYGKPNVPPW